MSVWERVQATSVNSCMQMYWDSEKYLDISLDGKSCYSPVFCAEVCLKNEGTEEAHL